MIETQSVGNLCINSIRPTFMERDTPLHGFDTAVVSNLCYYYNILTRPIKTIFFQLSEVIKIGLIRKYEIITCSFE